MVFHLKNAVSENVTLWEAFNNKLAKLGDAIASHLKLSLTDPPTDRGNWQSLTRAQKVQSRGEREI